MIFWIQFLISLLNFSDTILEKRKKVKLRGFLIDYIFLIIYLFYLFIELFLSFKSDSILNFSRFDLISYGFMNLNSYFLNVKTLEYSFIFLFTLIFNFYLCKEKKKIRNNFQNIVDYKYTYYLIYMTNILPYIILINILFVNCYDDGLKSLPIYFLMTLQFLFFSIKINHLTYYRFSYYLSIFTQIYLFFNKLIVYYANTTQGKNLFLKVDIMNLFGKTVVEDNYDKTGFLLNLSLLFLLNLHSNLLIRIKDKWDRIDKIKKRNDFKNLFRFSDKWYFFFSKRIFVFYNFFSDKIAQILLILWGLSRISLIKFIFLSIGIIGLCGFQKLFMKYLSKVAFFISVIYIFIQTSYNFSFVNYFVKSLGTKNDKYLFVIGFYKYYNLFHAHLLQFSYSYDEIKVKRKNEMIWDMFVFSIFFIIYHSLKKKKKSTTKTTISYQT